MTTGDLMKILSDYDPETPFGVLAHSTEQDEPLLFYENVQVEQLYLNEKVCELPVTAEDLYISVYDSVCATDEEKARRANTAVALAKPVISVCINNSY